MYDASRVRRRTARTAPRIDVRARVRGPRSRPAGRPVPPVAAHVGDRRRHVAVREQRRLDLAEFDAEAADLHLEVGAARGTRAGRRAVQRTRSPVRYIRCPGAPNGLATKRSAVSARPAVIAAGERRARRRTARRRPRPAPGAAARRAPPRRTRASGAPMVTGSPGASGSLMFDTTVVSVGPYALNMRPARAPTGPPVPAGTPRRRSRRTRTLVEARGIDRRQRRRGDERVRDPLAQQQFGQFGAAVDGRRTRSPSSRPRRPPAAVRAPTRRSSATRSAASGTPGVTCRSVLCSVGGEVRQTAVRGRPRPWACRSSRTCRSGTRGGPRAAVTSGRRR